MRYSQQHIPPAVELQADTGRRRASFGQELWQSPTDASEKQLRAAEGLGPSDAQVVYEWSVRWALAMAPSKAERVAAIEAHLRRLTQLHKDTKQLSDAGRLPTYLLWATEYYLADTEIELAEAKRR